jgi:hypothetical protein
MEFKLKINQKVSRITPFVGIGFFYMLEKMRAQSMISAAHFTKSLAIFYLLLASSYQTVSAITEQSLNQLTTYFIAILQWSIGHLSSASIDGGYWLELLARQMIFSHIPPKQCAIPEPLNQHHLKNMQMLGRLISYDSMLVLGWLDHVWIT